MTPQLLARWDEAARAQGRPASWRWSDAAREENRHATLAGLSPGQDLWVYSYGSLMWDPGLHFAEVRKAELPHYQRRFCFRTTMGRGNLEHPALMLSLEWHPPACCRGLVFRIAPDMAEAESQILWRREMIRGSYCPRLLPVQTPQGPVVAVVFTANAAHGDYVGELPTSETARMIATAVGDIGSNRDYLEQLAAQLQALDIQDAYVVQLVEALRALP